MWNALEGRYFIQKKGESHRKGWVIEPVEPGIYLIQLESWFGDVQTNQEIVPLLHMTGETWKFYEDYASWQEECNSLLRASEKKADEKIRRQRRETSQDYKDVIVSPD